MKRRGLLTTWAACWLLGGWLWPALGQEAGEAVEKEPSEPARTLSSSRQMVVQGGTSSARGELAVLFEGMKRDLLALLQRRDQWSFEIVARLFGEVGDPAPSDGDMIRYSARPIEGGGFQFLLDLKLNRGMEEAQLRRTLLELLLMELALRELRGQDLVANQRVVSPWVLEGIDILLFQRRLGFLPPEIDLAMKSRRLPDLEIVTESAPLEMDRISRALYGAASAGLVQMLLEEDKGRSRFVQFLQRRPLHPQGDAVLLDFLYREMSVQEDELHRWWAIKKEQLAQPKLFDAMGPAETDEQLARALEVAFLMEEQGVQRTVRTTVHEVDTLRLRRDRATILLPVEERLKVLRVRGSALYREVVEGYLLAVGRLVAGQTVALSETMAELRERRAEVRLRAIEIENYLDWFQANQVEAPRGIFRGVREAQEEVGQLLPKREDEIALYLDAMQARFANQEAPAEP
ncbi:MAG: hypothetical protein AAF555_07775 [Verrucomicrobiota bacterium]